jgi:hypothetical protein
MAKTAKMATMKTMTKTVETYTNKKGKLQHVLVPNVCIIAIIATGTTYTQAQPRHRR